MADSAVDPCAPWGVMQAGICNSQLTFAAGPSLTKARDHHGTALVQTASGTFLYVIGGTDYARSLRDVYVAQLQTDGSLGPFRTLGTLPSERSGQGLVVHGDRIFLVGGRSNNSFLASVISAQVQTDGSLGGWDTETDLPAARFHIGAVASDAFVYAIGGVKTDNVATLPYLATSDVFYAPLGPDGHLGAWHVAASLPEPRSHFALHIHEGHLYAIGGFVESSADGTPLAKTELGASIGPDGAPGVFAPIGMLADPVATASVVELQGSLYLLGGLNEDDSFSARIRRASLLDDGKLGDLVDVGMLPEARSHVHHTPYYNGHLYSVGGSIALQLPTDAAWVGTFAPPTGIGTAGQALTARSTGKKGARCACSY